MNFMISILGWALWNWGELELKKRELDGDGNPNTNFSFKEFKDLKWSSWIGSFLCCFLLLYIGWSRLDLKPLESITGIGHGWNDLYYFGSGFAWEAILFGVVKIKTKFKK